MIKKFFGFGSSTPPPPAPPSKPPPPPVSRPAPLKSAPGLVGQWREPGGSDITEFRADGTVVEKPASGETIRGRYSLDGAKLKIQLEGVAEELSFAATVKADELEMKDSSGVVTRYTRAK